MPQGDPGSLLELSHQEILDQLLEISARHFPEPGQRQVSFTRVETLLCYGLFFILNPHRYGGANIHTLPTPTLALARFFRRTPGSLTNKMLNLDGSRLHSGREEPLLFAFLAAEPAGYHTLYKEILTTARTLSIGEETLPDFLGWLSSQHDTEDLLGQEELPQSIGVLLARHTSEMQQLEQAFQLDERFTEKFAERKIRLAQHRFAVDVIQNCGRTCVFCGFEPRTLIHGSGLLRTSHIKPWAVSDEQERVDVRNGLAACPMHDAAFDQGYLTVNGEYHIHRAALLQESIIQDNKSILYFGESMFPTLLLPSTAQKPASTYLAYHREHIFRG